MPLLPLALSAHASGWNPVGAPDGTRGQHPGLDASCRFCGFDAAGWQEPFHLDGDHANAALDNIAAACPLCHLCQHMDRPTIPGEAVLIWLPEVSQGAVIALARRIHLVLRAHDEPPHMERGRPVRNDAPLKAAWAAQLALRERAKPAEHRLGTSSPLDFAAALLGLSPAARKRGDALLQGLRLLPLGHFYRDRRDVYPSMLDAWASAAPPATPSVPDGRPGRPAMSQ